jgi:flagellar L-ring protein precursor FlgH
MFRAVISVVALLGWVAVAGAQSNGTPAAAPANTAGMPAPARPAAPAPSAVSAQMRRNGGSLFAASLAAGPQTSPGGASAISFFAVPEPTPRTLQKHDLVTVIVHEDSNFSSQSSSDLEKTQDFDSIVNAFLETHLSKLKATGVNPTVAPETKFSNSRDFKSTGTIDRSDSLTARITAEIIDVKPNGTLTVQALKTIKTDDEVQQFVLTGVCRAEDVAADNTVESTQMYNLELQKNHMGDVRDTTRQGLIPRFLNAVNPF